MSTMQNDYTKKATPTEYKGVKYRSKTEAMFSVYLHEREERNLKFRSKTGLGGTCCYSIDYEPSWAVVDSYCFDFCVDSLYDGGADLPSYRKTSLYEVKPAETTKTYKQSFKEKCSELFHRHPELRIDFFLFEVNFFKDRCSVYRVWVPDNCMVELGSWFEIGPSYMKYLRSIRFDLVQP